jgi:cell division protein FtsB
MVADFNKKRKGKFFDNKLIIQLAGVFIVIVLIFLIVSDFNIYKRKKELKSQINFYQKQIEELKEANQDLNDKIDNADNIDYLEKIAYEQLGEQKPGEKGVIFITQKEEAEETPESKNFWTSWFTGAWNWIKSAF